MEKRTIMEQPLLKNTHKKGGFKALAFILGNDALEKMATYGVMANMILYLTKEYHMEMAEASNILFLWSSAINFTPLVGAVIADSYLGRLYTVGFGSVTCLVGMILLWATTLIPQARPPSCDPSIDQVCISSTFYQTSFLCISLVLISIGAGGIRSSSLAFGANQLENKDANSNVNESYFGWYYASRTVSYFIALTCVVYVQDNMGWRVGLALSVVLLTFGNLSFFLGSPFYVEVQSKTDFTGFFQVVVASYRNRHLRLPRDTSDVVYHYNNGGLARVFPSAKLRFLNKACIVKDPQKDLTPDGKASDPWTLCTVQQVENLKSLLGVIPIWSTGMIMFVDIVQNSIPVLQAASTNRHISRVFTIPAASISMFAVISSILFVTLYDRVFIPLSSNVLGQRVSLNAKTRMGFGILTSFVAMIVTSGVETIRRSRARHSVQISALWLLPQHCLGGVAEASNDIAQNEFYFSELPRSMSSVASTLDGLGLTVANLVASLIMNVVDYLSRAWGRESWISTDIDKGRYDYYYLVLAGVSLVNVVYFLVCSKAYGPLKEERTMVEKEDEL